MIKKAFLIKVIAFILSISILLVMAGCKNDKKSPVGTSSKNPDSSNVSSGDTDSQDDIDGIGDLEDLDFSDIGSDDFEFNFTVSQTVNFQNSPVQKEYVGLMGVLPCYWFVPDSTMDFQYTQEEIDISVKRFLQMGISVVRCLCLEPAYSWNANNDTWDWNSAWISGFYKYCDIMQANGIDVILNTSQSITSYSSQLGLENPIVVIAKKENPALFVTYDEKNITSEQRAAMMTVYGNWLVDFYNEVVVKRGYTCVKYFEHATEANNSMEAKPIEDVRKSFDNWILAVKACHDATKKAGIRNKLKFVGPSVVHATEVENPWTASQWLKWCVSEYDYLIDIYAAHSYGYGASMTDDLKVNYDSLIDSCYSVVKSTGKPFWCDEFNVLTRAGEYLESSSEPNHGTQIALGYIYQMIHKINGTAVWYPVDIKWPNTSATTPPSWDEGIHKVGLDTSILESTIPRYAYYAYCLLGTAIKAGDTVYNGVPTEEGLYSILLEHKDGTSSIIAINLSWNENEVDFKLFKSFNGKTLKKGVYDPITVTPTTKYKPIEFSEEIKNVKKSFSDKIGAYQVVVYNQK